MRFLLLSFLFFTVVGLNAQSARETTLTGKVYRPLDTLLLAKRVDDLRYQHTLIPVGPDSTFTYTILAGSVEEYRLAFKSEFDKGAYRTLDFFGDSDRIVFELYTNEAWESNTVTGSPYTALRNTFRNELIERWEPAFIQLQETVRQTTDEAKAKALSDSLQLQVMQWKHKQLEGYPIEIRLSNHYDDLEDFRGNEMVKPVLEAHHRYWSAQPRPNGMSEILDAFYTAQVEGVTGQRLIDFYLYGSEGDSSLVSGELRKGGFLLLDLWAPWCGPCLQKSKEVKGQLAQLKANSVSVVGVLGGIKTDAEFEKGKARFAYPWPVYPEVNGRQKIWIKYGFERAGGGQVLIDGSGNILAVNPTVSEVLEMTGAR